MSPSPVTWLSAALATERVQVARLRRRARWAAVLGGVVQVWTLRASANGAFPDSAQILLPEERPDAVVLGTNFGLVMTDDGGGSWHWVCETPETNLGRLYQLGQSDRILGISSEGLVYSDDTACSWQLASGLPDPATDAFVTAADRQRVLAIAGPLGIAQSLYESTDGGSSFGAALLTLPEERFLTSVESARSNPNRIYLSSQSSDDLLGAALEFSEDGGQTWESRPLPIELVDSFIRIVDVDPDDPERVFLRVSPPLGLELLAVSGDGGKTYATPVPGVGVFTGFLRRADGTLLMTAIHEGAGLAFESDDGGDSFDEFALPLRLRALAERDGVLFGTADNFMEGVALARSGDDGVSWEPVLDYAEIDGIKPCVAAKCSGNCGTLVDLWALWPDAVCGGSSLAGDASTSSEDAPEVEATPADASCACASPAVPRTGPSGLGALSLLLLLRRRSRSQG